MPVINCKYCNKEIKSKEDLVLGTHIASNVTPYHLKCFDEAKVKQGFFIRPAMKIEPKKFNFFIGVNIFNIVFGVIILLLSFVIDLYPRIVEFLFGSFCIIIGIMFVTTISKYKNMK